MTGTDQQKTSILQLFFHLDESLVGWDDDLRVEVALGELLDH